jgi:hypothetical protein
MMTVDAEELSPGRAACSGKEVSQMGLGDRC